MEPLFTDIKKINEVIDVLRIIYEKRYGIQNINLTNSLKTINDFISELKVDLYVYVEHPYVDKMYRDTYYNYFASKRDDYPRDTIRLSFFKSEVKEEDFRNINENNELQEKYLGFVILRPTYPFVIGRNVISPKAFKSNDVICCLVNYTATVNGLKLDVKGFPHSSQDQETITCAETTVWSILEYFGNKYPEYRPYQPSQVNAVLGKFSFERLIPSKGLTAGQISFALREFGFGVKIYAKAPYGDDFERLLKIYIESGIPVVGAMQNTQGIGHALNIIGRSNLTKEKIDDLSIYKQISNNVNVYDFADINFEYVFIDDNYPPYRQTTLDKPASYYTNPKWLGCEITSFIVPLYPKIYMEAGEARSTAISLVDSLGLIANKDILIKTFLTSSRSFKNEISLNGSLDETVKELLLSISMPKFIWVTELSDKDLILQGLVNGMVILDATEPKRFGIISALIENNYIANNLTQFKTISLPLHPFKGYSNNLK